MIVEIKHQCLIIIDNKPKCSNDYFNFKNSQKCEINYITLKIISKYINVLMLLEYHKNN